MSTARVMGSFTTISGPGCFSFYALPTSSIGIHPQGHRMAHEGCQSASHCDQDCRKVEMQKSKRGLFSALLVPFKHLSQESLKIYLLLIGQNIAPDYKRTREMCVLCQRT